MYLECPYYGNSPISRGSGSKVPDGSRNLTAAPNPAQNSTVIAYRYPATNEGGVRTLEVYDMTGRRLAAHTAGSDVSGKWMLPLDGFAAGIYQVIMKQDGRVLETARLSITR